METGGILYETLPAPEPRGQLALPPRRPPTAVATRAAPWPPEPYDTRLFRTRRMALGLLAALLLAGALPLGATPSIPRTAAAAACALAGIDTSLQAVTSSARPWREVVAPAARHALADINARLAAVRPRCTSCRWADGARQLRSAVQSIRLAAHRVLGSRQRSSTRDSDHRLT